MIAPSDITDHLAKKASIANANSYLTIPESVVFGTAPFLETDSQNQQFAGGVSMGISEAVRCCLPDAGRLSSSCFPFACDLCIGCGQRDTNADSRTMRGLRFDRKMSPGQPQPFAHANKTQTRSSRCRLRVES